LLMGDVLWWICDNRRNEVVTRYEHCDGVVLVLWRGRLLHVPM